MAQCGWIKAVLFRFVGFWQTFMRGAGSKDGGVLVGPRGPLSEGGLSLTGVLGCRKGGYCHQFVMRSILEHAAFISSADHDGAHLGVCMQGV